MRRLVRWLPLLLAGAGALLAGCEWMSPRSPGERLWRRLCADCHGVDAAGNTVRYMGNPWADLRDDNWKYGGDATTVEEIVRQGIFGEMPGHDELSPAEMRDLLAHLYKLRGETP